MQCNMNQTERILRIYIGLTMILLILLAHGPNWLWIGLVPLATGIINFCPLYRLIGINHCDQP